VDYKREREGEYNGYWMDAEDRNKWVRGVRTGLRGFGRGSSAVDGPAGEKLKG
jgi:hypothetical protein